MAREIVSGRLQVDFVRDKICSSLAPCRSPGIKVEVPTPSRDFDVVILGGSLAGASSALLLLRQRPELRVAVVEKSERFGRRVGEATVEISGYFLSRVLGLTRYLNETQLNKQGMRFWFANAQTQSLDDSSEIGGKYLARIPAWQVDRSTLDEEVLNQAQAAGAVVFRPAKAREVHLLSGGRQTIELESTERPRPMLTARWVIDATGFTCQLARQEGWFRRTEAHPTTAAWARWKGVKDWDGRELAARFPAWSAACQGVRATATNHLMGDGWWAWCIPLKGGDYSVGVVFDQRIVRWPAGPTPLGQRLKEFLCAHPTGRVLFEDAEPVDGDVNWRANLAYRSEVMATDGAVLVGDAAGFIDPFYSPGMDWLSFTVARGVDLVLAGLVGEPVTELVARHNRDFQRSYARWFEAIYQNKYAWMGDYELVRIGFRLDLGLYYLGVVSQPLMRGAQALREPVFSLPTSEVPYQLIRAYNRRLTAMAWERRRRGTFGRANTGRRMLLDGFVPERRSSGRLGSALLGWAWLELTEGWRTWFRSVEPGGVADPRSVAVAESAR